MQKNPKVESVPSSERSERVVKILSPNYEEEDILPPAPQARSRAQRSQRKKGRKKEIKISCDCISLLLCALCGLCGLCGENLSPLHFQNIYPTMLLLEK